MRSLMTTIDLAGRLEGAPPQRPVLLDVRWRLAGPPGRDSYRSGHLPGAVYLDLDTALAAPPGTGGRHPLPSPGDLQAELRVAGVRAGHPVVVYDDGDGSIAARAWWLLRWAGHREVAVLDGGFAAWAEEGRPLSAATPDPEPGDIEVEPGSMPVLDAEEAAGLARDGVLLDARAPERYRGETEPIDPRAGHVPGARNAPFAENTGEDGRWRTPAELAAHYSRIGVTGDTAVGAYCGSGVTACSVVLALEVAGRQEPAALYAGSWSHWAADPARPVATGELPG
ncbi:thiosulfate/3-mercaptopyruvate sulfurtransferase [Amycolatopsis marina]|uniref:Thiosulfate/3-mercaptopyruvate sulfurtransferase n=1 Tax=Amycolatopsis marina TaxID=490629 RepID=A0A1I1AJ83_9PSEU|nr:sulfurtransferase [Amycolatopsis marina]SFB37987.1 thiosulfate/3-mercaptopyruvate sulfurtransferase [Amycolatopsis marina]